METKIRILDFYRELIGELADWARTQGARDADLAFHGEAVSQALSQERRDLPQESLFALGAKLSAFAEEAPHKRTILSHLEKYLGALQAAAAEG